MGVTGADCAVPESRTLGLATLNEQKSMSRAVREAEEFTVVSQKPKEEKVSRTWSVHRVACTGLKD